MSDASSSLELLELSSSELLEEVEEEPCLEEVRRGGGETSEGGDRVEMEEMEEMEGEGGI